MKKFWDWKNRTVTNEETQEQIQERTLFLNGTIAEESWFDDDVTPQLFKDELMSGSGNITVWINSPGGDCVAAAQIYNMLMDYHGDVTVKIDGIAASAASVIAMAGTKVLMSPTALMMIHNPLTVAIGDSEEMQKAIDMLSEVRKASSMLRDQDRLVPCQAQPLMDAETWMNANKAVELALPMICCSRQTVKAPLQRTASCSAAEPSPTRSCPRSRAITPRPNLRKVQAHPSPSSKRDSHLSNLKEDTDNE